MFFSMNWAGNSLLRWTIAAGILLAIPILVRTMDAVLGRNKGSGGDAGPERWYAAIRAPLAALIRIAGLWAILYPVLIVPDWLQIWIDRLFYAGLMLWVGWFLSLVTARGVDAYLARDAGRDGAQQDRLLHPLFRGASRIVVWALVLVVGLQNAGFEVGAIVAGLGLGGLAVAMASKDILVDILGGIYIMINRPFKVGDKIMYNNEWATVLEFGLRTTSLRDFSYNFKYIVPNSYFTSKAIVNISDHPGQMVLMNIRLSLTNPADRIEKALALVQDILKGHREVRYIWTKLDHFDDYAFTLRIHYDILEFSQRNRVKTEINLAIAGAFQGNGIKFAARPVRALQDSVGSDDFVG